MRKIIVLSMITIDGVMQAPSGPEEDTSVPITRRDSGRQINIGFLHLPSDLVFHR